MICKYIFPFSRLSFSFLIMFFDAYKFLIPMKSSVLIFFSFVALALVSYLRIHCQIQDHEDFYLYFPLRILWFFYKFFRKLYGLCSYI